MPRFVLLHHALPPGQGRSSHYDLMLEQGNSLRTWALAGVPAENTPVAATPLADHRLAYLDYEGEVSGSRGSVTRIDQGNYELVEETADFLRARLHGDQLRGILELRRQATDAEWVASFHK